MFLIDNKTQLQLISPNRRYCKIRQSVISYRHVTNYDNLLLQFVIAWLLQILDNCCYNLRRLLLQFNFTTGLQLTTEPSSVYSQV